MGKEVESHEVKNHSSMPVRRITDFAWNQQLQGTERDASNPGI